MPRRPLIDVPEMVRVHRDREGRMSQNTNSTIIAKQNDLFRQGDPSIPGQIVLTSGLAAHVEKTSSTMAELAQAVQEFDAFTEDNDPHAEHDFGRFTFEGADCFWKIDLYNDTLDGGSDAPTDLTQTHRILTIMLVQEY
jgi:hypothetical protein